jgi:hypothetical protein
MTAEIREHAAAQPWPALHTQMRRIRAVGSPRLRTLLQSGLLRLALLWLSLSIAWAGLRLAWEHGLRRRG